MILEDFLPLIYGQIISLILSSTFIFIQLINEIGIFTSLFPLSLVYHILTVICISKWKLIRSIYANTTFAHRVWLLILGITDYTANFCMLKAFQFTSGPSAVLISSTSCLFTIPLAIVFLQAKYNSIHAAGTICVIFGMILINVSKFLSAANSKEDTNFELVGTLLATFAAMGFSITAVIQKRIASTLDRPGAYPWTAISSYGFVSSLLSLIMTHATDFGRKDRDSWLLSSNPQKYFLFALVVASSLFYLTTPLYLQRFSPITFQMSLLTSDILVYIFNIFYLETVLPVLYMAGFFIVIGGLVIFNLGHRLEQSRSEYIELSSAHLD